MTVGNFLRVLPLMVTGSFLLSYVVKYDVDQRAFWAILGAVALFLAGILVGLYLATSPRFEDETA